MDEDIINNSTASLLIPDNIPEDLLKSAINPMQEDRAAAIKWFKTPLPIFENISPIDHLSRDNDGASDVRILIGRIRSGTYS